MTTSRTSRRAVALVGAISLLVITSACGARWTDAQREEVLASRSGTGSAVGPGARAGSTASGPRDGTSSAGVEATTGPGVGPTATTPGIGGTGDPGAGPAAAVGGVKPCAAPSDAPGVTDKTITLGSISTLSGAVPGLGASAEAAARAYVAYRNATGGVCGREVALKTGDDGMDNGRHRAIVTEMNPQVLGLVGGLGGGDAGSAEVVTEFGMPVVNGAISKTFDDAPVTFNISPYFADVNQPLPKFQYYFSEGVRKAAIAYTAVDQTRSEINLRQKPQMIASGIEVVAQIEIPLGTLSYDSAARQVANSGADYLFFLADGSISASMARSMHDTGYKGLKFAEYLTAYGTRFPELAGPGAEGAVSTIRTLPNEDGGAVPEQAAFLEWMERIAPDQSTDTFAADSWVAAKAFIDSLEALPGPITREAVLAQLAATGEYDAGGFLGPVRFGEQLSKGCVVLMQWRSGKWNRLTPDQGFRC